MLIKDTTLSHKAFIHQCRVVNLHTRADNEIRALNTRTQLHRSKTVGVNRTVLKARRPHNHRIVADAHVLDAATIEDVHIIAYGTEVSSLLFGIIVNTLLKIGNHLRTVTIERQHISQTRGQFVEDRNLATTTFIHHRYTHAVTESCLAIHQDSVHVLDTRLFTDAVVSDVVVDIVQMAVVIYFHVVQRRVEDTGVHLQTAWQRNLLVKSTKLAMTRKTGIFHIVSAESVSHFHVRPVLSHTVLRLQLCYFLLG